MGISGLSRDKSGLTSYYSTQNRRRRAREGRRRGGSANSRGRGGTRAVARRRSNSLALRTRTRNASHNGKAFDRAVIEAFKNNLADTANPDIQKKIHDIEQKTRLRRRPASRPDPYLSALITFAVPVPVAQYLSYLAKCNLKLVASQVNACHHPYHRRRGVPQKANVEDVCVYRDPATNHVAIVIVERKFKAASSYKNQADPERFATELAAYAYQARLQLEAFINHRAIKPNCVSQPGYSMWTRNPIVRDILNACHCAVYITYNGVAGLNTPHALHSFAFHEPYRAPKPHTTHTPPASPAEPPARIAISPAHTLNPDTPAGKALVAIANGTPPSL